MMHLLFENLVLLLLVCVGVQFLLIIVWSRARTRLTARAVWVGFVLFPCLMILSALVVTRREGLIHVCRELARAVEQRDVRAIGSLFATDLEVEGLDRQELLDLIEGTLSRHYVSGVTLNGFALGAADREHPVLTFRSGSSVRSLDGDGGRVVLGWRLTFRREADRWVVEDIESEPVPPFHVQHVRDLLR